MSDADASRLSAGEVKRQLQAMDDEDFEYFVADLWEQDGWTTEVSQKSRDKSLDVLAERDSPYHQRHAIQAKRYQEGNRVGGPKVSEYASLRDQFDADAAVIVTTSGFTKDARERGDTLNVKLVDGDDLVGMVEQYDAHDLVKKYTTAQTIDSETTVGFDLTQVNHSSSDRTRWGDMFVYGGATWTITLMIAQIVGSESQIGSLAAIIGVVGVAVMEFGLYKDLGTNPTAPGWDANRNLLMLGALFLPFVVVPYYMYRRGWLSKD